MFKIGVFLWKLKNLTPECNKWPWEVSQKTLHGTVAWRAGTLAYPGRVYEQSVYSLWHMLNCLSYRKPCLILLHAICIPFPCSDISLNLCKSKLSNSPRYIFSCNVYSLSLYWYLSLNLSKSKLPTVHLLIVIKISCYYTQRTFTIALIFPHWMKIFRLICLILNLKVVSWLSLFLPNLGKHSFC